MTECAKRHFHVCFQHALLFDFVTFRHTFHNAVSRSILLFINSIRKKSVERWQIERAAEILAYGFVSSREDGIIFLSLYILTLRWEDLSNQVFYISSRCWMPLIHFMTFL